MEIRCGSRDGWDEGEVAHGGMVAVWVYRSGREEGQVGCHFCLTICDIEGETE